MSMVHEHYQQPFRDLQTTPNYLPQQWGWPRWDEYQELLRKAQKYDEMMKQPDCPDPEKEKTMKEIERRLVEKYGLRPSV